MSADEITPPPGDEPAATIAATLEQFRDAFRLAFVNGIKGGADPFTLGRLASLEFASVFAGMVQADPDCHPAISALLTTRDTATRLQIALTEMTPTAAPDAPVNG